MSGNTATIQLSVKEVDDVIDALYQHEVTSRRGFMRRHGAKMGEAGNPELVAKVKRAIAAWTDIANLRMKFEDALQQFDDETLAAAQSKLAADAGMGVTHAG